MEKAKKEKMGEDFVRWISATIFTAVLAALMLGIGWLLLGEQPSVEVISLWLLIYLVASRAERELEKRDRRREGKEAVSIPVPRELLKKGGSIDIHLELTEEEGGDAECSVRSH